MNTHTSVTNFTNFPSPSSSLKYAPFLDLHYYDLCNRSGLWFQEPPTAFTLPPLFFSTLFPCGNVAPLPGAHAQFFSKGIRVGTPSQHSNIRSNI